MIAATNIRQASKCGWTVEHSARVDIGRSIFHSRVTFQLYWFWKAMSDRAVLHEVSELAAGDRFSGQIAVDERTQNPIHKPKSGLLKLVALPIRFSGY
jgi:hypothetical protein